MKQLIGIVILPTLSMLRARGSDVVVIGTTASMRARSLRSASVGTTSTAFRGARCLFGQMERSDFLFSDIVETL